MNDNGISEKVKNVENKDGHQPNAELPKTENKTNSDTNSINQTTVAAGHVIEKAGATAAAAAEAASKYSQQYASAYVQIEQNLMQRMHESSRRRFRVTLISTIVFIVWVVAVFGKMIRKALSDQTAGLAKETLSNDALKVQTEELAMAVVQTVLNDTQVTAHAATFLREAAMVPETQQALLKLTLHVLQHKDSQNELSNLIKKLIAQLSGDKESMENLGLLFASALQEPTVRAAAVALIADLCKDPEVVKVVTELTLTVINKEEVSHVSVLQLHILDIEIEIYPLTSSTFPSLLCPQATGNLLTGISTTILGDQEVVAQSRDFVVEVMGDELIQREGGDAIWNSVRHALKPGIIRIAGLSIVCFSLGLIKVMLSPF